ncbi:DUF3347 domain-containing protein [Aureisphaera galaxeae]|uniref:DUF3347 domain-containing protein n=1 Tax=Aureisphaera galaxeae TaxID=1538023 RepID=UPI0023510326|nr:DUF3347 domain-containing protein [Aureisphaera galaxeae]MDC8003052.1 DUF3347 domain-containing protein [Aureisphaera galaxeae]
MKVKAIVSLLVVIAAMISCKNDKTSPEVETVEVEKTKEPYASAPLEAEFNDPKVADVYNAYNALKTALVNTDAASAQQKASELLTAYSNMGVEDEVFKAAQAIAESEDVKVQRTSFSDVSAHIEGMLEGALTSGAIYKQYCPMAFNNTGGYWLSNTKEIRNPYFGDIMLKCGRVDSTLK